METNLLTLVDSIYEHMGKGIQFDVLYFEFRKAFDRVDNDRLLSKLGSIVFSLKQFRFFANDLQE